MRASLALYDGDEQLQVGCNKRKVVRKVRALDPRT